MASFRWINSLWLLLLFILLSSTLICSTTVISSITPEQIKDIGDNVELNCAVENSQDNTIGWSKINPDNPSENVYLVMNDALTIKDNRYDISLERNGSMTLSSFHIKNIEALDMGTYECQVIVSKTHKLTKSVNLLVRHSPVISEMLSQKSIIVPEGQNAEMICVAEGYPRPRISWKREHNGIMPMGGHIYNDATLKFRPAHRMDRGGYYCVADNSVGKPDQKIFTVEVEFPPVISTPRPRIAQAKFYGVDLVCKVEAYPAPAVAWYKNGQQLSTSGNYKITNMATAHEITNSILRILTISDKDYGDYFCNATNKMGQSEARVNLYQSVIPVTL